MYILGLNAFHGDAAACLFKDDQLIMAIEEERLRRIKHWAGFPIEAIKACLAQESISITDIRHITISRNPSANLYNKIKHTVSQIRKISSLTDRLSNTRKVTAVRSILAKELGVKEGDIKAEIHNIEHHLSHLASAFFASPFKEAAILSIDGFGDFTSTMTAIGKDTNIKVIDSVIFPHSIGIFYTAFTQYLGFMKYGDEYKVMGLAPYGKPKYLEKLKEVIELTDNGLFRINEKYFLHSTEGVTMIWEKGYPYIEPIFSDYMEEVFGKRRKKDEEITQVHKDLAASVQKMTELSIFHISNHLHKKTGLDNLCIVGGVAQNSVANGKIYENTPFKNIYIPPAATDAGTSIGSALWLYNIILGKDRIEPMYSANTGSLFTDTDIDELLDNSNLDFKYLEGEEIKNTVTDCLIEGGVIGWFKGRSEFGPRALGYRSILLDPRREDAKDLLNMKIKKREKFRPFAPSILREYVSEYFEQSDDVLFMEKVFKIKKEKRKIIPAVTHVDGTGRLQTVHRKINPEYYDLIKKFHDKTGVPILLNTSFNENEPIVNSPKEAIDCFLRTKMDMLVLENYVIQR